MDGIHSVCVRIRMYACVYACMCAYILYVYTYTTYVIWSSSIIPYIEISPITSIEVIGDISIYGIILPIGYKRYCIE